MHALESLYGCMVLGQSDLFREKMMDLTIVDDETTYCCSWRLRFCPSIGRIGSDCDRIQILSRDPSASLPPCTCGVVGNWLIVKRLDRYHMFLADMQSQHLCDGKFWKNQWGL